MKLLLTVLILLTFSGIANAQFFGPKALPSKALKLGEVPVPVSKNFIRPAIGITASISDGTTLAGGVGVSFEHDKWDAAGNAWSPQYSIAGIAFLDSKASIIGGVAVGVLGLFNVGVGYNFTAKGWVFMPGVQIKF